MRFLSLSFIAALSLSACAPNADEAIANDDEVIYPDERTPQAVPTICSAIRTDVATFPSRYRSTILSNARSYANYSWTPAAGNLAPSGASRCNYTVYTSANFKAGIAVTGFPYKKAGYDSISVFNTCKPQPFGTGLYLGGTVTQVSLGRGCGVLGLDCAGFIAKAWGMGDNDYTNPSMIHNNCTVVGTGKDYAQAKGGDILKRYGVSGLQDHFMIVNTNTPSASSLTVYEAGSVISTTRDRVRLTSATYTQLSNASFTLCRPKNLIDP